MFKSNLKTKVIKGALSLTFITPLIVTNNLFHNSFLKNEEKNVDNTRIQNDPNDLVLTSVVADIESVTINYEVNVADTTNLQLIIYDDSNHTMLYDDSLSGSVTIDGLIPDHTYSNWKAVLNRQWFTVDQDFIPSFTPLKEHKITNIEVTNIIPDFNSVTIEYNLDTNIPYSKNIAIAIKNSAGDVLLSNTENNLNGSVTISGLEMDTKYSGWTITATDSEYDTVTFSTKIDEFTTETNLKINDLSVTSIETTFNSATINYEVDTNVPSDELIINVLDDRNNLLTSEMHSKADGTIVLNNLQDSTWYRFLTLQAVQLGHEDAVNSSIQIDDFKTKVENPFISEVMVKWADIEDVSINFNIQVTGNLDADEYGIEVLDEDGNIIGDGHINGRRNPMQIHFGNAIVLGLTPNTTYHDIAIKAFYIDDPSVSKITTIHEITTKP